MLSIRHY